MIVRHELLIPNLKDIETENLFNPEKLYQLIGQAIMHMISVEPRETPLVYVRLPIK